MSVTDNVVIEYKDLGDDGDGGEHDYADERVPFPLEEIQKCYDDLEIKFI